MTSVYFQKSYRKRVTVARFKDSGLAKTKAAEYAELLEVSFTKFNPPVSDKTKARKAR